MSSIDLNYSNTFIDTYLRNIQKLNSNQIPIADENFQKKKTYEYTTTGFTSSGNIKYDFSLKWDNDHTIMETA